MTTIASYKIIAPCLIYSISLASCIYYKLYSSCALFEVSLPIIGVYFIIDAYNETNTQYIIHHVFCLSIFAYGYYHRVVFDDAGIFFYHMLKTELSNVFLVLRPLIDKKSSWYHVNNIVFLGCFTKTRVMDMYYGIIRHNSMLYPLVEKYSPNNRFASGTMIASCYGLYGLNLYWFVKMNSILYSMIVKHTRIREGFGVSPYFAYYVLFAGIPIYTLMYVYNIIYIDEMVGVPAILLASHIHYTYVLNKSDKME